MPIYYTGYLISRAHVLCYHQAVFLHHYASSDSDFFKYGVGRDFLARCLRDVLFEYDCLS